MRIKKYHFSIIAVLILLVAYIGLFGLNIPIDIYDVKIPGAPDIRFGIDIRGGVDAVFEPSGLDRKPTAEELEAARSVIETRMDNKNILDRDVTVDQQNGYILVRFPWKSTETEFNPQEAIAELGQTAKLTFRDPDGEIVMEGSHIVRSYVATKQDTGEYVVEFELDSEGAKLFDEATARLIGKPLSIYMDETLITSPTVESRISGGRAYIDNMGSVQAAKELSDLINAGALPFSMVTRNHSTISPTLGSGALEIMVQAGILAFAIICVFLLVYYRLPGVVACFALLLQVSGQLLALSIPQITLTLPGIAGVILSIGMGVDANIIISERISEELRAGKTLKGAISSGFKRAFSSVFDGNITVIIVAAILYIFGSGAMLSFAYSLFTGVLLNFLAGVTVSRLMMKSVSQFGFLSKPSLYTKLKFRRGEAQ